MTNKKLAIMQPYFFPYIGYFQLIKSVDEFVIYDNIKYTKKGWINRNRILVNSNPMVITLPLRKDSDYLMVADRKLADVWTVERKKTLLLIKNSYNKALFFEDGYAVIEKCLMQDEINLFKFLFNSILYLNEYLGIKTPMIVSSTVNIDHTLKSQDKVLAICKEKNAQTYVNAIGGIKLYSKEDFNEQQIDLKFISSSPITYAQFNNQFVPWLSIIDVIMFNSKETITQYLNSYTLI